MFGTPLDRGSGYLICSLQSYVNEEEKAQLIDIRQRLETGAIRGQRFQLAPNFPLVNLAVVGSI